jgi:hypothetical protein
MIIPSGNGKFLAVCHICEISGPEKTDHLTPQGWEHRVGYELTEEGAMRIVAGKPVFAHVHLCPSHRGHKGPFVTWTTQQIRRIKDLYKRTQRAPELVANAN